MGSVLVLTLTVKVLLLPGRRFLAISLAFPFEKSGGEGGRQPGDISARPSCLGGKSVPMQVKPLLRHILENEAVTRGLGDPEARVLVEWLVEQAERLAPVTPTETAGWQEVKRLCHRARSINRFVRLWCHERERGAAVQLAAAERFHWPLPTSAMDPCELMQEILTCEASQLQRTG